MYVPAPPLSQVAAMLRRLVVESRPDGLHVRAKRWEEDDGEDEEYEEEGEL